MQPRASNPRAAWPSRDDQALFNLIVIAIGLAVGGYLLWTNYHAQISAGLIALRHREMLLLAHVTDRFAVADAQIQHANPYRVSLRDLYGISHAIGRFWRLPACIFIVLLAAICTVRAAPSRFRRAFDLDGLVREQAQTCRTAAAFLGRRLGLTPQADGEPLSSDYALTPGEWIARFASDAKGGFDEERARRALVRQLGPRWAGPVAAAPVAQLLFAAFALHLDKRRDDAAELLGAASVALAPSGSDAPAPALPAEITDHIAKLLADPEAFAASRRIAAAHAYTVPALMSVLNAARLRQGVLAPAQFAWLKLIDRPLWYALHSLGFETEEIGRYLHPNPRVEALGARDHWAVEGAAGAPVAEPDLERALQTLRRHAHPASRRAQRSPYRSANVNAVRGAAAQTFCQDELGVLR